MKISRVMGTFVSSFIFSLIVVGVMWVTGLFTTSFAVAALVASAVINAALRVVEYVRGK